LNEQKQHHNFHLRQTICIICWLNV
jgi:hypothetical protein